MPAPVKHTCPDIDKVIKALKDMGSTAKDGMNDSDRDSSHYQRYKDIEWDIDGIIDQMEELRNSNARLRDWGENTESANRDLEDEKWELEQKIIELSKEAV